jgi:hypothetical protein
MSNSTKDSPPLQRWSRRDVAQKIMNSGAVLRNEDIVRGSEGSEETLSNLHKRRKAGGGERLLETPSSILFNQSQPLHPTQNETFLQPPNGGSQFNGPSFDQTLSNSMLNALLTKHFPN